MAPGAPSGSPGIWRPHWAAERAPSDGSGRTLGRLRWLSGGSRGLGCPETLWGQRELHCAVQGSPSDGSGAPSGGSGDPMGRTRGSPSGRPGSSTGRLSGPHRTARVSRSGGSGGSIGGSACLFRRSTGPTDWLLVIQAEETQTGDSAALWVTRCPLGASGGPFGLPRDSSQSPPPNDQKSLKFVNCIQF